MEPIIEVKELCKKYKSMDGYAVRNMRFSVQPGEIVGVLGPNGAGKSTLIKMLLGVIRPTSGALSVMGMQTVSHLLVNTALIFLVSVLFGRVMRLGSVCLGVLSTLLGFTILYLIQAVIGCCALWFRDITRFRDVVYTLLMMLGGRLIPSGMLFGGLKQAVYFTPLPYVYDVPVRVFLNQGASLRFLGVQLLWILLLGGAYWYLFHCHVRQNIEFGG